MPTPGGVSARTFGHSHFGFTSNPRRHLPVRCSASLRCPWPGHPYRLPVFLRFGMFLTKHPFALSVAVIDVGGNGPIRLGASLRLVPKFPVGSACDRWHAVTTLTLSLLAGRTQRGPPSRR
ncbi:hypothetical protein FAGKG844_150015 [Frankia sp. AgKG'84/4]